MEERDIAEQIKQETQGNKSRKEREETRARRCGNYNRVGHNARTCQIVIETSEEDNSVIYFNKFSWGYLGFCKMPLKSCRFRYAFTLYIPNDPMKRNKPLFKF